MKHALGLVEDGRVILVLIEQGDRKNPARCRELSVYFLECREKAKEELKTTTYKMLNW